MLVTKTLKLYQKTLAVVSSVLWMSLLIDTDSYFFNYLLIGILCLISAFINIECSFTNSMRIITVVFSSIFSGLITIANYSIYYSRGPVIALLLLFSVFLTGVIVFYVFLKNIYCLLGKTYLLLFDKNKAKKEIAVFLLTFISIVTIDLLVLFLSQYPGELSTDSINQISQVIAGVYSNNHPYWHSIIIKTFYNLGYFLFNDVNAAIATYSVFQIIIMALIESYANMTLRQMGAKSIVNVLFCLFFALVPYNYIYSITMWKDVLFAGSILLFIICIARIFMSIGNSVINYILFVISCFEFNLLRSNGWYAFVLTTFIFFPLLLRKYKRILLIMVLCLGCTYIMQHPVLEKLGVTQPELIESLSIPVQQISRAIVDNNDLSQEEIDLLSNIIDVSKIETAYESYISNPIKDLIRERNNQAFLKNNMYDYFRLYIRIGLRHPISYIFAFIDETRGYYNSGYDFWICSTGVAENSFGIQRIEKIHSLTEFVDVQSDSFNFVTLLNPIISVGVHVWIVIVSLYIGIMKKDRYVCALSIPLLSTIASLLVATPVFCEFRYAYAIFTSVYFVLLTTIKNGGEKVSEQSDYIGKTDFSKD